MVKRIDAPTLAKMIISAANNLENNKEYVDSLNVFPVPDGDTGTNMSMTFNAAARQLLSVEEHKSIKETANLISSALLRGARGNSGVILSQIFRGVAKALNESAYEIDTQALASCLTKGTQSAFKAVTKPTEGTILTVIRECAHAAYKASKEQMNIVDAFNFVIEQGNIALDNTPEQLPALKSSGVVDSGGKGLMLIFEGMFVALRYEMIVEPNSGTPLKSEPIRPSVELENIKINYAYCTEFLIKKESIASSATKLKSIIHTRGDSLVVVDDDDYIKVHIHTNHPGVILEEAVKFGELFKIKIENMKEQMEAQMLASMKELAVVAVASGDGFADIFTKLGVSVIINGGQTMNPSTDDILNAVKMANAKNVIILPNNKNIILSAQQAAKIAPTNIIVINTRHLTQGICAMLEYDESLSIKENDEKMGNSFGNIVNVQVTTAVRDTKIDGLSVKKGDFLGLVDSKIKVSNKSLNETVLQTLKKTISEEHELVTIYSGADIGDASKMMETLENEYPEVEFSLQKGGQAVYQYIISIE